MPSKEDFYSLHFLRVGSIPHHAGPHGEVPDLVRRQKEKGGENRT